MSRHRRGGGTCTECYKNTVREVRDAHYEQTVLAGAVASYSLCSRLDDGQSVFVAPIMQNIACDGWVRSDAWHLQCGKLRRTHDEGSASGGDGVAGRLEHVAGVEGSGNEWVRSRVMRWCTK
jgi:hypothetical protein